MSPRHDAGGREGVWLISDGNPGEYNQALAVAEALARQGYGPIAWVSARRIRGFLRPAWGWLLDLTHKPLRRRLEAALVDGELPPGRPKIIISSGGKTAHASVAVSRRCDAPNVFIGTPPGMSARHFGAILHTEAHWSPDNGMRLDLLPTRLSPAEAREKAKTLRAELGITSQRLCAMLLGGNSRTHTFQAGDWRALAEGMNHLAASHGFKWLVTSSRRTGGEAEATMRSVLDAKFIADATWWGIQPRPVMVPYLSASDVVFCTQDSRTMLSEGIAVGKPVYALFPDKVESSGTEGSFSKRFLEQNESAHRIRRVHIAQTKQIDIESDLANYFETITTDVMQETIARLMSLLESDSHRARAGSIQRSRPVDAPADNHLPFGSYAPSRFQSFLIAMGHRLPRTWAGMRIASLIRSLLKRWSKRPFDAVRIGSRMRLHPSDNASEKRLTTTPQFFDTIELAVLATRLTPDFVFLDVGANVGTYTLFVANRVGRGGRIVAVEPHPTALGRLRCNLALNGIDWVHVAPVALSDRAGTISLFINDRNVGSSSILFDRRPDLPARGVEVPCRTLLSLVEEEGLSRIDAIKLDVEGAEDKILLAYFSSAPRALWPRLLLIEDSRSVWKEDLLEMLQRSGYVTEAVGNSNLVLRLDSP